MCVCVRTGPDERETPRTGLCVGHETHALGVNTVCKWVAMAGTCGTRDGGGRGIRGWPVKEEVRSKPRTCGEGRMK